MEHYDFICDEGLTSLRLLQRNPLDANEPLNGIRVHVRCTDCVAGLDVDAESWAGFVGLFTQDYAACGPATWISPAGEWKLHVQMDEHGLFTITSELDSLLDYHTWFLRTRFSMSADRFRATSEEVLAFIGIHAAANQRKSCDRHVASSTPSSSPLARATNFNGRSFQVSPSSG